MNDNFLDLLAQQKPAVFLSLGAAAFVLIFAFLFRRLGDYRAEQPKVILRRISWQLRSARDEFSQYPATREIHEIVDGLDSCERTINKVVARL
jgi:hypothetical protein